MSTDATPEEGERKERRTRDRRGAAQPEQPAPASWFGALGVDSGALPLASDGADEKRHDHMDDIWEATSVGKSGSPLFAREARRIVVSGQSAFQRIYDAFISARAALGVTLISILALAQLFGVRPPPVVILICLGYATLALGMWVLPRYLRTAKPAALARLRSPQWLMTIGADIICFVALHLLSPVASLNYLALLIMPVLMGGVLTPRRQALATAAIVTLAVLSVAWLGMLLGGETTALMTQAGLAGSGFFVITLLAGEMAGRLAREEMAAKGSMEIAKQQAQLNRLVIEELHEGVLVVDRTGRVRATNPAARALLSPHGLSGEAPFQLRDVPAWDGLLKLVESAFSEVLWPEEGRDIRIDFGSGVVRTLRVRTRFTRRREPGASEEVCVLFLEDVRSMQARARQEKLAAMGRISAGIAHEIRNPLAAISQANALLAEDVFTDEQKQLTRMISENGARLKRIVDDVMEVASGKMYDPGVIDATAHVAAVCREWARLANLPLDESGVLSIELPAHALGVVFDGDHLRRVLINLLDNARRHASNGPGSIRLSLHAKDDSQAVLSVASDGDPIHGDVERYLFEPFFSTRSRGTGLGLYICRELCERYGARIDYRLRASSESNRNEFFVAMSRRGLVANDVDPGRLNYSS